MKKVVCRDNATFDQSFAAARAVGADVFEWQGEEYHTKTVDEMRALAKNSEPPVIIATVIL